MARKKAEKPKRMFKRDPRHTPPHEALQGLPERRPPLDRSTTSNPSPKLTSGAT